jgi:putative membrane protein
LEIADKHGDRMGLILALIVFVGLAAIIVWVADWTSGVPRGPTAIDVLNRRFARGEIDRAEYDEKRRLIGR